MDEKNPLDSLWNTSNDTFPVLNPSKVRPMQAAPAPAQVEQPVQEAAPQPQKGGIFSKIKDAAIGTFKGIGETVKGDAKLIAREAPKMLAGAVLPGAQMLAPSLEENHYAKRAFDAADRLLKPTNEVQAHAKDAEQIAELFVPFLGAAGGVISKMPKIAEGLEEVSLRLTSAQKRDLGEKVQQVSRLLIDKGVTGTPQARVAQVEDLYKKTEDTLQNFLNTNPVANKRYVSQTAYIQALQNLKGMFANSRDQEAAFKQIEGAIENIKKLFPRETIPVARFNEYKRSVYDGAYNKVGTKVLDDVEAKIGSAAKEAVEQATEGLSIDGKDIAAFNKEYGTLVNARTILKGAEAKDQVGILGKIVSFMIGGGIGAQFGPVGAGVGALAAQQIGPVVAGTAARSYAAQFANTIGKLAPATRKALGTLLLGGGAVTADHLESLLSSSPESQESSEDPQQQQQLTKEEEAPLDSLFN